MAAAVGFAAVAASLAGAGALAAPLSRTAGHARVRTFGDRLYGVTATSAANAWAVGTSNLIVHWNGHSWSRELAGNGFFVNVSATSASDAWAVGGTGWFTTEPMIYHWNGSAWSQKPVVDPALGGYFNDVTAVSPTDVWAVGLTGGGPGAGTGTDNATLIEHWNGRTWARVASPALPSASGLDSVSATSAGNIWAVGWTGANANSGTDRTLIEHWNGHAWTRVPSPSGVPGVRSSLRSVVALSASDAWAVGVQHELRNALVFIVHWNGKTWTKVHAPTPGPGATLMGVAATGPDNVWAVGQTTTNGVCSPAKCATAMVHWNGRRWSVVPSPNPPSDRLNALFSISFVSGRNAWAVGTTDYAKTLIIHWNGHTWR